MKPKKAKIASLTNYQMFENGMLNTNTPPSYNFCLGYTDKRGDIKVKRHTDSFSIPNRNQACSTA